MAKGHNSCSFVNAGKWASQRLWVFFFFFSLSQEPWNMPFFPSVCFIIFFCFLFNFFVIWFVAWHFLVLKGLLFLPIISRSIIVILMDILEFCIHFYFYFILFFSFYNLHHYLRKKKRKMQKNEFFTESGGKASEKFISLVVVSLLELLKTVLNWNAYIHTYRSTLTAEIGCCCCCYC